MYENNLEGLLEHRVVDPRGSDVGGLWWGVRIFISNSATEPKMEVWPSVATKSQTGEAGADAKG